MNESSEQALQRISDQRAENLMRAHDEIDRLARLCEAKDADNKLLRALHKKFIGSNKVLAEKLSEAQAQIAMKDEALKVAEHFVDMHSEVWYASGQRDLAQIREAISATSETVAAWGAKETEPLRREVAMLRDKLDAALDVAEQGAVISNYSREQLEEKVRKAEDKVSMLSAVIAEIRNLTLLQGMHLTYDQFLEELNSTISDTQATALAYEREVENRGAMKALENMLEELPDNAFIFAGQVRKHIEKLRASNKGEVR